jgi:hypothetical protein
VQFLGSGVDLESPFDVTRFEVDVAVLTGEGEGPIEHRLRPFGAGALDAPDRLRSEVVVEFAEAAEASRHPVRGDLRRRRVVGDPRPAAYPDRRAHFAIVVGDGDQDCEAFRFQGEGEIALDFASGARRQDRNRDKKAGAENPSEDESAAHGANDTPVGSTNARMISMFTVIARSLRSTPDSIAIPCSVKTRGLLRRPPCPPLDITNVISSWRTPRAAPH